MISVDSVKIKLKSCPMEIMMNTNIGCKINHINCILYVSIHNIILWIWFQIYFIMYDTVVISVFVSKLFRFS